MKQLGLKEARVFEVDLSEEEEKALNVALNNPAIGGEFTRSVEELLAEIEEALPEDFEKLLLDQIEADIEELEEETREGLTDEDETPEPPKVAKSRLGDLWILGEHRLLCGDSTNEDQVSFLMNGEKADMVFTDPPYGMNLDTDFSKMPRGGNTFQKVKGDNEDFNRNLIDCIFSLEADRYCVWGADWFYQFLPEGFSPIVWDKQPHHIVAGPQNHFELCFVNPSEKRRIIRKLWTGFTAKEKGEKRVHPTQKPIDLCEDILAKGGQLVVDLFGGSGSTLIACEKTNRKCFMMELDPIYIDVILQRWADYTGKDPVRDADGKKWSEL